MSPLPVLPELQQYLLSRKLVPGKNALYFAYWVKRYLAFSIPLEKHDKIEILLRFLTICKPGNRWPTGRFRRQGKP